VLIFLKTPKTEVVGHLSLSERHRKINGQGTAQDPDHMDGCAGSTLFLLHYDVRRVVVTPHFSARRLQRRGRRSYWALAHVECHRSKRNAEAFLVA
jgi:hypothetical protein